MGGRGKREGKEGGKGGRESGRKLGEERESSALIRVTTTLYFVHCGVIRVKTTVSSRITMTLRETDSWAHVGMRARDF